MSFDQIATLATLIAVVAAVISGKVRADLAALAGAAFLGVVGVLTPMDLQRTFASQALIALASLFIIVHALERTGLVSLLIGAAAHAVERLGGAAAPLIIGFCGSLSAFMNNTPLVLLAAPILKDMAADMGWSPKRLLLPLSYAAILGGTCTLIGTATNLLVDGMAQAAGLEPFGLFEISKVGLTVAFFGGLYLLILAPSLLPKDPPPETTEPKAPVVPFQPIGAAISVSVFGAVVGGAFGGAPLAVMALAGALVLIFTRVLSPEEAYASLRPQILLMIAGMLAVGAAVDKSGLALAATEFIADLAAPAGPHVALAALYLATLLLTEIMSNAAVAVLVTPLAIGLALNLGVDPRPFVVTVMMAASAAFATPFGYQTNTIVYEYGGYRYVDFLRAGVPLNIISWTVGVWTIPHYFPF